MEYGKKIKNNLANYKKKHFPDFKDGIWKWNKKNYPHILPESEKYFNLLPQYKYELIKYIETNAIKLHIDFHHLNSSQAMCLNFFYPLIHEHKLEIVLEYLGFKDELIDDSTICFEKDGIEKCYGESPTSFDFYFETKSRKKFYFEIKYTEQEFGKAKHDQSHENKFEKVYSKHLAPITEEYKTMDKFLDHYQILRNLIHLKDESYVIFLYPEDNQRIKSQAENAKSSMITEKYKNNYFPLTWESIFKKVKNDTKSDRLLEQLSDFKKKYFLHWVTEA